MWWSYLPFATTSSREDIFLKEKVSFSNFLSKHKLTFISIFQKTKTKAIDHFRIPLSLSFKASLSAKFLLL